MCLRVVITNTGSCTIARCCHKLERFGEVRRMRWKVAHAFREDFQAYCYPSFRLDIQRYRYAAIGRYTSCRSRLLDASNVCIHSSRSMVLAHVAGRAITISQDRFPGAAGRIQQSPSHCQYELPPCLVKETTIGSHGPSKEGRHLVIRRWSVSAHGGDTCPP